MNKDITYYHEKLKKYIHIVEENEDDEIALSCVDKYFRQVYEIMKIYLIAQKDRYYGYFLMNLNLRIRYDMNFMAATSIETKPFELIINPLLLGVKAVRQMLFVLCHEIEHLVLEHPAEMLRMNPHHDYSIQLKLNIAMDASINDRLVMEIQKYKLECLEKPDDIITSADLCEMYGLRLEKLQDYMYYFKKIPLIKYEPVHKSDVFASGQQKIITEKNRPEEEVVHVWSKDIPAEDARELLRNFAKEAMEGVSHEDRGMFPAHQKEVLDRLLQPPRVHWQTILRKYLGTIPCASRKTRSRIDRRQPERYDISGRISDRTIKLVVAVDTSGSMTAELLQEVFVEIFELLKYSKYELTIIECDAAVQNVYTARKLADVNLKLSGRGGTAYTPVIEYINQSKEYQNAVLIYFTDGGGEFEIPRPRTYRNLWVLAGQWSTLSLKEPYGEVITMQLDGWELIEGWWPE